MIGIVPVLGTGTYWQAQYRGYRQESTLKRPTQWIITAVLLVVLSLGGFAAAVFYNPVMVAVGADVTGAPATVDPEVFAPPPAPVVEPAHGTGIITGADPAAEGSAPDPATLQSRLQALDRSQAAVEEDQAVFAVDVVDTATGQRLAGINQDTLVVPASNTKTLTVVALMAAVDGDETFTTSVVQPAPGEVVLVGGGDPMLTRLPTESDYPVPASLEELAIATAEELQRQGAGSVTLGFDAGLFDDDGWNATWPETYRTQVTQISALWVDNGRLADGSRSLTPALDAARAFAELLTTHGIEVTGEPLEVPEVSGTEIASVTSLPVHVLAEQAMLRSDNSWTEVLGFQLARLTGHPTTFEGSVAAIEEKLRRMGAWTEGAVLFDASGLSRSNLVSAAMLAQVNRFIVDDPQLSVILDGLPVAGVTGTLRDRFSDTVSAPARGVAKAKTGTLTGVSSLGGNTVTADGRVVAFAVMVNGSSQPWPARVWIDQVVGTITGCGC